MGMAEEFCFSKVKRIHWISSTIRAVGMSENPGVPVLFGGHNLSPLVEIGLTDLPKSGTPRDDRPAEDIDHLRQHLLFNFT